MYFNCIYSAYNQCEYFGADLHSFKFDLISAFILTILAIIKLRTVATFLTLMTLDIRLPHSLKRALVDKT